MYDIVCLCIVERTCTCTRVCIHGSVRILKAHYIPQVSTCIYICTLVFLLGIYIHVHVHVCAKYHGTGFSLCMYVITPKMHVFNRWRACAARVLATFLSVCLCVCVSVCLSVTTLAKASLGYTPR